MRIPTTSGTIARQGPHRGCREAVEPVAAGIIVVMSDIGERLASTVAHLSGGKVTPEDVRDERPRQ